MSGKDTETNPTTAAPEGAENSPIVSSQAETVVASDNAKVEAVVAQTGEQARNPEALPEYPTFTREVASISPESAKALKAALKLGANDLIVGLPPQIAEAFGIKPGEIVHITTDGTTVILGAGDQTIKIVTETPKGALTKIALSKGIREHKQVDLNDGRANTGASTSTTDTGDAVPFTLVRNDHEGKPLAVPMIWLKVGQKKRPQSGEQQQ